MKISTEISSSSALVGEEKAIELIAKAGFDAWDFSMFRMCRYDRQNKCMLESDHPLAGNDYLAFAKRLKRVGLENGIVCNQSHAPFPTDVADVRSYFKRAIECTAEAGGDICVIHPFKSTDPVASTQMYNELLPFAKSYGVRIATENMWNLAPDGDSALPAACATAENFCEHIDAVGDDSFVACLDIGHAEMVGDDISAVKIIKALGPRLQALHIHDNDKCHDCHQIPFSMDIDFEAVVKALKEIGYSGYFTMEANDFMKPYTSENALDGLTAMAEVAKKLVEMYNLY